MEHNEYHNPVLLSESIEALNIKADGTYIDLTFGGGGHSTEILAKLDTGKLFAFDQDTDVKESAINLSITKPHSFTWINGNFRYLKTLLQTYNVTSVDGILADLGVSSHQFDTPDRGFSFRFKGSLDMRMNSNEGISAKKVLNEYTESELHLIFGMYGEIHNAKTLANAIIVARAKAPIETTKDLQAILLKFAKRGQENKYQAQVFQALRIKVNDEIKALEEMLLQTNLVLKKGGRLVVITYHSLEDKLVKNYIRNGKLHGDAEKDLYGNVSKPFEAVNKKPIEPSEQEILRNGRARSAKLRIAIKVE